MKQIIRVFLAVLLIATVRPAPATAQLGSLIDKIQEMSGPKMFYLGPTFRWGYQSGQAVDSAGLGEIDSALTRLNRLVPSSPEREAPGILESRVVLAGRCLGETGALINRLTSSDSVYDERSIDRYRENRRRLQWLAGEIPDPTEDREVRAGSVAFFADLACRQPEILARALENPDPMHGVVGRFGLYSGTDTRLNRPLEVDVRGLMAQLSAEYLHAVRIRQRVLNVGLEAGLALHYFYGDIDPFFHPTFPIRLNVHPFARCRSWVTRNIRFGGAIHVIPPFRSGAFDGIYTLDDGWEVTDPDFFVAWDYSIGSGPSGGGLC